MAKLNWWIVLLMGAISLPSGCAREKAVDPVEGKVGVDLMVLANAYLQATEKNKQPPKGLADLKPFLPADKPADSLLRSVRDGEPFVILWGTDPREGMGIKPLVIGYEQKGKGGTRMVFTAMGVMTMDESGFAAARFPPGHKP